MNALVRRVLGEAVDPKEFIQQQPDDYVYPFTSTLGRKWVARIVMPGGKLLARRKDKFQPKEHGDLMPVIEFYDASYDFHGWGQFVSSYYISTLLKDRERREGLDLAGNVKEWKLSEADMQAIYAWIFKTLGEKAGQGDFGFFS